ALGVEGHQMPLPILQGLLQKDGPSDKVRAVSFHPKGGVVVWEKEDRSRGHSVLEGIEGHLLWESPTPCNVLPSEVK
ncbi:hypothetical protein C0989_009117, partial [Termitomyces sp. Mn162]